MGGVRERGTEGMFWKVSLEEETFKLRYEVWEEQDKFSSKKGDL